LAQADDEELAGGIRLQADQVEQGEVGQRSAVGAGGVLGDRQVDLVTQDAVQHVVAFRRGGHDHLCVVGRVLVRGVGVGFGCPAPGVWISPYTGRAGEAEQVLKEAGVRPGAQVFLAGHLAGGELPALVGQAWDLDGLGREYEAFVAEFTGYRSADAAGAAGPCLAPVPARRPHAARRVAARGLERHPRRQALPPAARAVAAGRDGGMAASVQMTAGTRDHPPGCR
jgi:hypothetical protein